jgi:hypothetical protein
MMDKSFKTPKGTELPFFMVEKSKKNKQTGEWIKLPPQPYLQVAHRLVWFREEHPDWQIYTEIFQSSDTMSIVKATIKDEKGTIIATAHKREDINDFNDHLEKAETSAIGRALAMCGYGTQFAPEMDEGDRLADSPTDIPTKNTTSNSTSVPRTDAPTTIPKQAPRAGKLATDKQQKMIYMKLTQDLKLMPNQVVDYLKKHTGKDHTNKLEYSDIDTLLEQIAKDTSLFEDLPF